jgi:hypothetical protein
VEEVPYLRLNVRMGVGPAAEREAILVRANALAKLPRVLDTSWWPHVTISAEHDERFETMLPRSIRVREAVFLCVLARQEGNHVRTRNVGAQVGDQMAKVVFFAKADCAIG